MGKIAALLKSGMGVGMAFLLPWPALAQTATVEPAARVPLGGLAVLLLVAGLLTGLALGAAYAWWAVRRAQAAADRREQEAAAERSSYENASAAAAAEITAMAAARDRLQTLLDNLPVPIWRRDTGLGIEFVNQAYARAVEADRPQVLAKNLEIAGGNDLARRVRDLRLAQSESRPIVLAGDRRLFEFTEQPLPDGGMAGFGFDVTSLESTQFELARHVQAHAEVLESLGTGIIILGPDTRLKFFNDGYRRLFGLEAEALRGEPTLDELMEILRERRSLPEQSDFPAYKREVKRQLMSTISAAESLLHLPDGRTARQLVAPHPFGGVVVSYEDVTDTLALERSFNTLTAVQRETLDNLYEGIAVFGADGRLKLFNPAYVKLWGLDGEELAEGPHISILMERMRPYVDPVANWKAFKERVLGWIEDRTTNTGRLERTDGSVLEFAVVPLPDGATLLIYFDVSDSERVQRALAERNAALETADRLKSEFLANVSYELRTPLNAIIGFSEILHQQYFGRLNERQAEYSQGIMDASQQLLNLINDILDIATIEAGYLALERAPVEISSLLQDLLAFTAERARNRGLTIELDCPPDIGTVIGDQRRLKQAIFNLISNSIKYTGVGGTIRIGARREADQLVMSVADNGVGIAEQDQAVAFEKFSRIGGQRQGAGGLGLALVKSLIELHGGSVELQSKTGQGTKVTCRLPFEAAPEATAAQ